MLESIRPAAKLALIVEYDGSNYRGFQYQNGVPTIQNELEKAIGKLTGEEIRIRGASRTDSGVHAEGQVVDFTSRSTLPDETWVRGLNYYLPWNIKIKRVVRVPYAFHSRKDAMSRTYRYTILNSDTPSPLLNNRCAWVRANLDVHDMAEAAQALIGTHDFSPFAGPLEPGRSGIRKIERWDVWREEQMIYFESESSGFMRHQILKTNGILTQIGKSKEPISTIQDVMDGRIVMKRQATALPARGLCLLRVQYSNFPPREG